ncbi:hypothetical protein L1887_32551 [Cichorium endivia]|nr:hypothetical protein L1887_32551 [Cichorium endivia]
MTDRKVDQGIQLCRAFRSCKLGGCVALGGKNRADCARLRKQILVASGHSGVNWCFHIGVRIGGSGDENAPVSKNVGDLTEMDMLLQDILIRTKVSLVTL